jgi:hypothetical protein
LDEQIQKYYENRFDLCTSVGWKELMDDLKEARDEYARVDIINSVEDLWKAKGKIEVLDYILNLHQLSEQVYQEIIDGSKDL